eukprot:scaffold774_cov330-Pavlova_lutheri.AAC.4
MDVTRGAAMAARPSKGIQGSRRTRSVLGKAAKEDKGREVALLDYGAGNVRSLRNALRKLGCRVVDIESPAELAKADRVVFPGVGSFGAAVDTLRKKGYMEPLRDHVLQGKPFLGICIGLQVLFEGSEESSGVEGLGIVPGVVGKFDASLGLPVPHIGWSGLEPLQPSKLFNSVGGKRVYFVHSYRAEPVEGNRDWILSKSEYAGDFISAIQKGEVYATQFHPEKSGPTGLRILENFLDKDVQVEMPHVSKTDLTLAKRVIACLDVRTNDSGDLVVTKGDQYDVREKDDSNEVRNLGKPVELAGRYFLEGADEVAFLNITGFRDFPLSDVPMLEVMKEASKNVFVPMTVGGGIRDFTDSQGRYYSSLEVAAEYFRSGADKISIGSDAVYAAEEYIKTGVKTGRSSIEQISHVYGAQAVVVSIDPKTIYVPSPDDTDQKTIKASLPGPNGEEYCWYQCTVSGGREGRPIGAYELARAVEALGAGEILLNCIDKDGKGDGFDHGLIGLVADAVSIPVIASSGAGKPEHFSQVFQNTNASAALAAGIFHRQEVSIDNVKSEMAQHGIPTRL